MAARSDRVIVELSTQDRHVLERISKALEKNPLTRQEVQRRQGLFEEMFGPRDGSYPYKTGDRLFPYRSEPGNVLVLGPELFLSEDEKVMCYKGQEYLKPCGHLVRNLPDGGQSFCVKMIDHPRPDEHEDTLGRFNTGFSD